MDLIGHLRRTVRRHAQLADAAIAVVVFTVTVVPAFVGHPSATGGSRALAAGTAAVACGALGLRRVHPIAVLAVSAMAAEAFIAEPGDGNGMLILLAPSIALYTVAEQVNRRRGLIVGGGVLAALIVTHAAAAPESLGPQNLAFAALGGLAIAAGDSSRNRRAYLAEAERRAEQAELEREQDARRRVAAERLRIARDLHDSVGHHLALISVQSDVAGRAVAGDAAAARAALGHVKSASRKALEELRDTVSLLRQPGDPVAPTVIPAPGLDALPELLGSLRASGLAIESLVRGSAVPLAPAADLSAYRVIQESLTNVYKHSRLRKARLTLGYGRRELRITIDDLGADDHPGAPDYAGVGPGPWADPLPAGGQGIRGMRERLLALGGRFAAGPRPGGGFRVDAFLPYQPLGGADQGDGPPGRAGPGEVVAGEPARVTVEPLP
jgi:signal transduction histidine kinase